jgi:hypothetical protein
VRHKPNTNPQSRSISRTRITPSPPPIRNNFHRSQHTFLLTQLISNVTLGPSLLSPPGISAPAASPRSLRNGSSQPLRARIERAKKLTPMFSWIYKPAPQTKSDLTRVFSIASTLFCALVHPIFPRNPLVFYKIRTLLKKHRGWGVLESVWQLQVAATNCVRLSIRSQYVVVATPKK